MTLRVLFSKCISFFRQFEVLGWSVIFGASLLILVFAITAAYFEITANRTAPIKLGKITAADGSKQVKAGEDVFLVVSMQWDFSRECSAYIPISIRGKSGEIYQSPPPIYYSKESVKKFIRENPGRFEFLMRFPSIAKPGLAYVVSDPVYECSDNRSFINNKITVNYVDTITIVK